MVVLRGEYLLHLLLDIVAYLLIDSCVMVLAKSVARVDKIETTNVVEQLEHIVGTNGE